ncbi:hypothetical protein ACU3L3_07015 [Priestia endophytica]
MGERICPNCEQESLVEKGLAKWICLNSSCGEIFDEAYLDAHVEFEED